MIAFESPVTDLHGIGEKTGKLLGALDIHNAGALLYNFPRTYRSYPPITEDVAQNVGTKVALSFVLKGGIANKKTARMDLSIGQGVVGDCYVEVIWFRMPYIKSKLKGGTRYVFYGDLARVRKDVYQIKQPAVFTPQEYEALRTTLEPVYHLTKGLTNKTVAKATKQVLGEQVLMEEYLPAHYLKKRNLVGIRQAIRDMHFPVDLEVLQTARRRLVYDEFLSFFLSTRMERKQTEHIRNSFVFSEDAAYQQALSRLPFTLTKGQQKALSDMRSDLMGEYVSQRLIQGDVGSGKTILAFLIMLLAVENGCQAAIMAPTEVLAAQHEQTFRSYMEAFGLPYDVVCVTGSLKGKKRKEANERIATEGGLFIIGTHALVSDNMTYHRLAVVVTDEQHRFGVKQRKALADKGENPHVLVMSATPIPRTLAMILYGDMNISVIKDVPATRLPVKNSVIRPAKRKAAWKFIDGQLQEGRQAYIICALVDASEKSESENVSDYVKEVRSFFEGRYAIDMLHGKMKPQEKDQIMQRFADNETQILVSTTVIEVGINVPNASVMLIEDANRFGLAQLHQLRGRVGRGSAQSYCMFVDASQDGEESRRLQILEQSNDGFLIAGEDLKLRGPGDFYGIRQSGDLNFQIADIYQDADILKEASEDAEEMLSVDPSLESAGFAPFARHMQQMSTVLYTNL